MRITVVLALLSNLLFGGRVSIACIDYGSYLHWVGSVGTPDIARGVVISGSYAYVADFEALQILRTQCEPASVPCDHEFAPALRLNAYPNPGSHETAIHFDMPTSDHVRVSIFDAAGRRVRSLQEGILGPGTQDLFWDTRDDRGKPVSAGVYLVRVSASTGAATLQQVLLR